VPLLRNAGGVQNETALKAREIERDASLEDLLQTSDQAVLNVVQAYWELASRLSRAAILRKARSAPSDLVAEIEKLVAADQIPGAELDLGAGQRGGKARWPHRRGAGLAGGLEQPRSLAPGGYGR
jgi:outer membrane protein TolC